MQLNRLIYASLVVLGTSSCMSEVGRYLPTVPTDIALYSEFSMEDASLHTKLHKYFNLKCPNGSSMSVITPLHITTTDGKKGAVSTNTQYKIVIGNNIQGNTIYYSNPKTEKLAHDISEVLNTFLSSYDQEYSHSINRVLPFTAHYLDHTSYLSTLANDPREVAITFKIGIDHSLPPEDKTQLVINLVVYLAKTLGSECLYAIPNTSDLQFSMDDCQCPTNQKSVEDENWVM